MECGKLNGKFLKVKAKVSGFLIAKVEKRNTPEIEKHASITIKRKKNTITGLQYLINAFLTYMRGVTYTGAVASSKGIAITTSTGQTFVLSLLNSPYIIVNNNSVIIEFIAIDDSSNSYTATSEQLNTLSAGNIIPIATANLTVTKNSNEVLTLTWIITITISTGTGIDYIPTSTPQGSEWLCSGCSGSCNSCTTSTADSLFPSTCTGCSPTGLVSQYPNTSFITSQLFIDMFYNNYKTGSSNPFISYSNGIIYIYTLYCMTCFVVGVYDGSPQFVSYQNTTTCLTNLLEMQSVYTQVCVLNQPEPYIGVQIEITT